jgi:16S rRNA processing protein RimM
VSTAASSRFVILGRVSGVYGVKGWVKVHSHTSPPANILEYTNWYLNIDGSWQGLRLESGRVHGKGIVAKLVDVDDRDQAAGLVHTDIAVTRDMLPDTDDGSYYWSDLEGLLVRSVDGLDLGRLDRLFETGSNDVMVVEGERQRLIPYINADVVKSVDLTAGVITVDWDPEF